MDLQRVADPGRHGGIVFHPQRPGFRLRLIFGNGDHCGQQRLEPALAPRGDGRPVRGPRDRHSAEFINDQFRADCGRHRGRGHGVGHDVHQIQDHHRCRRIHIPVVFQWDHARRRKRNQRIAVGHPRPWERNGAIRELCVPGGKLCRLSPQPAGDPHGG